MEHSAACSRRLATITSALSPSLAAAAAVPVKLDAAGEPVQRAIPLTAADDPEGADRVGLTAAEAEYFKANVRESSSNVVLTHGWPAAAHHYAAAR